MSAQIKAGIIGGAGYTGGETVRLLLNHPEVELIFVQSRSQAGKPVTTVHHDLVGETELRFSEGFSLPVDVLFLCLSHGESKKLLNESLFPVNTRIIDLGNDFRLGEQVNGREFIYGLPEFQREKIKQAKNIANPGCFATTIQLGLLPLAKAGLLTEVHTTGITGSTGAGQKLQDSTHFTWRANNISAYKTLTHQHLGEINQTIKSLQPEYSSSINFVPWRGDFTRGIFVSSVLDCNLSLEEATQLFKEYYKSHPFTHVAGEMIDIKQVVNTNKCLLYLEKAGSKLVIHSVTDNLLKGASGQAVQNMNLMFGLDETVGLKLKGSVF
ncbi:MAG: N-acetyl-gamma-glutamyl-phosphate reductase [Cytophagales bacterium]|nr:N-acetyl-gamma-glutamyl-phosphate reductase [Cytophagales bacterium]MCA6366068.1 N-acetyl-gamma-glutamyl-phosphate reductase [Cytophagales bacterium]MCA6373023.1 N-acetyl-gamma-glutamyl-phosphate reductase [Cytophagales bacterium]MCA6375967.1 N-acetyl-gamma-glutamyl-phosphate reductase [Cytophagales bacterium]MCA6383488.1 N-acetyl-gamma-glutamyl-phosphate reductase [Cytophagales bacterium]